MMFPTDELIKKLKELGEDTIYAKEMGDTDIIAKNLLSLIDSLKEYYEYKKKPFMDNPVDNTEPKA